MATAPTEAAVTYARKAAAGLAFTATGEVDIRGKDNTLPESASNSPAGLEKKNAAAQTGKAAAQGIR